MEQEAGVGGAGEDEHHVQGASGQVAAEESRQVAPARVRRVAEEEEKSPQAAGVEGDVGARLVHVVHEHRMGGEEEHGPARELGFRRQPERAQEDERREDVVHRAQGEFPEAEQPAPEKLEDEIQRHASGGPSARGKGAEHAGERVVAQEGDGLPLVHPQAVAADGAEQHQGGDRQGQQRQEFFPVTCFHGIRSRC